MNLFRGFMGEGTDSGHVLDMKFNFMVPSKPVLANEMSKYIVDISQPGMIATSLEAFSKKFGENTNVKQCFDAQKWL